jgi:hypothetical protein
MGASGCSVPSIQGHEVFDAGGDESPASRGGVSKDLFVREGNQSWICDDSQHIVGPSAQLLGDRVREHLIQQQLMTHRLTGEQVVFALPGMLGCIFGYLRSGYFGVNLIGVGRPVPNRYAQQTRGYARVLLNQGEHVLFSQVRLTGACGLYRAHDLPYIWPGSQRRTSAGGPGPEHDAGMLAHPQGLVYQPVCGRRKGHAGMSRDEGRQSIDYSRLKSYWCR